MSAPTSFRLALLPAMVLTITGCHLFTSYDQQQDTESDQVSDNSPDTDTGAGSETETEATSDTSTDTNTETDNDTAPDVDTETNSDSETNDKSDTDTDTDGGSDTETDAEDDTNTETTTGSSDTISTDSDIPEGPAFVSTWKTDHSGISDDNQINLPLVENGDYDFSVDWGDGTSDIISYWNDLKRTHTYASPGTYDVRISGVISGWSFGRADGIGDDDYSGDEFKIHEIKDWGPLGFGSTKKQFFGCKNLIVTAIDSPDLTNTTSLHRAFALCESLTTVPAIADWEISGVTDMSRMFYGASDLNQDLTGLDTSSVTDMSYLFYGATAFNGDLSGWNTASVVDMSYMFRGAVSFNRAVSNWNTSSVTNMTGLFEGALVFNQDLSEWDTTNVTYMNFMFFNAASFNQDISSWSTSKVTSMTSMFLNATAFNQNISGWDTSNVVSMFQMFTNAASFNQDLTGWETSNVTSMRQMFQNAAVFNGNVSTWNTSNVTNMNYMFYEASSFDQDLSQWDISNTKEMNFMFSNAALSTEHYDALLIGWESQEVQPNVSFNGGSSTYSPGAAAGARERLISEHGWTIIDGGEAEVPDDTDSAADTDSESDTASESDSEEETDTQTYNPPEIHEIHVDFLCADIGEPVNFSAVTTGVIDDYSWSFGDGQIDNGASPTHQYAAIGEYEVGLSVTGPGGEDSIVMPDKIQIIDEGWTPVYPKIIIDSIEDIWQSPYNSNLAYAVSLRGEAIRFNGNTWQTITTPVQVHQLHLVEGYDGAGGTKVLMVGTDNSFKPIVYEVDGDTLINADPAGLLPGENGNIYSGIFLKGEHTGYLAIGPDVWVYDGTAAPSSRWTKVYCADPPHLGGFGGFGGHYNGFNTVLFATGNPYGGDGNTHLFRSLDGGVTWISYNTFEHDLRELAVIDQNMVWLASSYASGLYRGIYNDISQQFDFVNHWETPGVQKIELDAGGNLLWVVAHNGSGIDIKKIVDADGDSPIINWVSSDGLDFGCNGLAVFDENQVFYGGNDGFLASWDGAKWKNLSGRTSSGFVQHFHGTVDGTLFIPLSYDTPNEIMKYNGDIKDTWYLESGQEPFAIWASSATRAWAVGWEGEDSLLLNFFLGMWMPQTLEPKTAGSFYDIWGSGTNDIWVVGGPWQAGQGIAVVLHYDGTWHRDANAEALVNMPLELVDGTAWGDVWASSEFGDLIHFDGNSWERVEQDIMMTPATVKPLLNMCLETDPGDACSGVGLSITRQIAAVAEGLFASLSYGSYVVEEVAYEGDICPVGTFRCVHNGPQWGQIPVFYDRNTWQELTFNGPYEEMGWIWATDANHAYAATFESGSYGQVGGIAVWDGSSWEPLEEQPPERAPVDYLWGLNHQLLYGLSKYGNAVLKYESCD